eukprot:2768291-Pleurochrysis_carterae.AAC.2
MASCGLTCGVYAKVLGTLRAMSRATKCTLTTSRVRASSLIRLAFAPLICACALLQERVPLLNISTFSTNITLVEEKDLDRRVQMRVLMVPLEHQMHSNLQVAT